MALPYCEIGVIILAICWKGLVLIDTFYSQNFINYTPSAGNLYTIGLKNSSETTSKTSRSFLMFYKHSTNLIDKDWLNWFIGFSEGDGAILTNKSHVRFVLTQKEGKILYHIQKVLGFGRVQQFKNYYRFIVSDPKSVLLLIYIFNGNLVLSYRQNQLGEWINSINKRLSLNLVLDSRLIEPNLFDSWLSGFTDAEGCFNINIQPRLNTVTGYRVMLRFILDQKNAESTLIIIRNNFGYGHVTLRKETNSVFRYVNDSFKGLIPVRDYFLKFPLKTKKAKSFNYWLEMFDMVLNKKHLNLEGLDKIRITAKLINKENSLNTKTGSSKP